MRAGTDGVAQVCGVAARAGPGPAIAREVRGLFAVTKDPFPVKARKVSNQRSMQRNDGIALTG
jgi:hypothetical protein